MRACTFAGDAHDAGRVVWITGLPCSGKSTLARHLAALLRVSEPRCIVLDGDQLRPAIAPDLGYAIDDRRRCSWRYARLAALLAAQDALVLVATLSMFEDIRRWSRAHAPGYFEVHLRIPERIRRARDRDRLYDGRDVVGVDQPYEEPAAPDLVVDDDGSLAPEEIAGRVRRALAARARQLAPGALA